MAALEAVGSSRSRRSAPVSVSAAAESGDTRQLLVAMRSRIATAVDDPGTSTRDLASLTKRLADVVHEIEAIDARREEPAGGPVPDERFDPTAV